MKKIAYYLSLVLAIAIFSGCGTSDDVVNNGFFQKRKYNKGYHTDGFAKKQKTSPKIVNETIVEAQGVVDQAKVEGVSNEQINVLADNSNTFIQTETVSAKVPAKAKAERISKVVSKKITKADEKLLGKVEKRAATMKTKIENKKNGSDDKMLYILLAIFIPWLAVGLATDWDISQVLLNLLLTFLCYIPGLIHALKKVNEKF